MVGQFFEQVREIWDRRLLLSYLISTTLKVSNKGMLLGYFWWILEPLFLLCIYYFLIHVVFGRGGPNYALFLLVALIPFRTMIVTLTGAVNCISRRSGMVSQISFPRIFLPVAETVSTHIMLLAGFLVIIAGAVAYGKSVGPHLIWLGLPFMAQFLIALGLTMALSVLGVFVPDLRKIMQWGTRAWLYGSPVLYTIERVPERFKAITEYNPMTPVLQMYREIIIRGQAPASKDLVMAYTWSFAILIFGLIVFLLLERRVLKHL